MRTKYFNDAFVGNGRVTASFSKTGELLRLYYPTIDYKQFFEEFYLGVKINDSALIYLHNDINNSYEQEYLENTNILRTDETGSIKFVFKQNMVNKLVCKPYIIVER